MDAKYNVTGKDRKDLVEAIENIAGMKAVYKKAPTFEYVVDNFIIDKEGTVTCKDEAALESLVESLIPAGYTPEGYEGTIALSIEIPFDKVDVGNLTKLLDAKGNLIKKALGIDDIRIEMQEDRVAFPWFTEADADSAKAYTDFIAALCRMSKEAKRVTATEKEVENEKYAFRCFLLRLGFIGDEFKMDRKILLKNLTGSSAFKDGGASHEITE
ncbi:MAG: virulence protein [Clostridiales bacterium]|nr:virulence protein [Clostridiales bacterium]